MVCPAGLVPEAVIVAAQRYELLAGGWSSLREGNAVVEVAVGGGHAAPGEDTGGVEGFDPAALAGGGATPGGATV